MNFHKQIQILSIVIHTTNIVTMKEQVNQASILQKKTFVSYIKSKFYHPSYLIWIKSRNTHIKAGQSWLSSETEGWEQSSDNQMHWQLAIETGLLDRQWQLVISFSYMFNTKRVMYLFFLHFYCLPQSMLLLDDLYCDDNDFLQDKSNGVVW